MESKASKKINKEMTIGEVMDMCPEAMGILEKYLGFCTTCSSAYLETIALGAHLHKKDANKIIAELNKVCKIRGKKK